MLHFHYATKKDKCKDAFEGFFAFAASLSNVCDNAIICLSISRKEGFL